MSRITQVFYGNDCLPYKDKERTVHYPITGCSFAGSSNVNELRFYVRDIGGVNNLSWVAIVKLPNGKILYQLLTDISLDSEINEYYVSFNLSSFYTQLKGDIYISLNGCLGQVEIETDEETDISTIEGEIDSKTVVATGAVKFTINYAPQRPLGTSFDLDQYQTIINALANKSNIISTFQIVADISQETLTAYNEGQVFYDLATKRFYKKSDGGAIDYNFVTSNQANVSIVVDPLTNVNGRAFVHYTSELTTISGFSAYLIKYDGEKATEEQAREYMAYMTGSSFLPKYNYDRPANTYFLTPNGELYKPQYDATNGLVLFILPQLALKKYLDDNFVPFTGSTKSVDLGNQIIISSHFYKSAVGSPNELPTKNEMNNAIGNAIADIKKNAFILVDTTIYPTLDSFLASTGEEGYIYLYPSTNQEQGYLQYIWEDSQWLDIGTTQIDLTNYYTKPQTNSLLNGKVDKTSSTMKLYGTNGAGNQDTISYGTSATNNNIVQRDSAGQIFVPTDPTRDAHATSKSYVDTQVAPKLDKTSSANKVYGTDSSGNQKTFDVDNTVGADGNIVRRASGTSQIMVPLTPTANGHASSKKYVDDTVASAVASVYRIKGSKTVAEINALTGQQVGDVYNVTDSGTIELGDLQVFTGDNIVWTGSAWDKLGAEIDWSAYDEKFIAAGFFEVQNYNESTGEITFVYATDLYIASYDADTGVMTIEAN